MLRHVVLRLHGEPLTPVSVGDSITINRDEENVSVPARVDDFYKEGEDWILVASYEDGQEPIGVKILN